nr:hypothetical protein [Tanacetum cinerariifolium]
MIDYLSIVETEKVIHTVETDIVKLLVEIKSLGMSSDEFDKDIGSSDGLQPKQADLSYVHALNKLHLHETRVVLSGRLLAPERIALSARVAIEKFGRQGQSYFSTSYKRNATSSGGNNVSGYARVVKCYNCQCEGHMARQCTQPKRPRNVVWYKDKAMLAEAQEARQVLDEERLKFLVDPGVPDGQAVQTIIPNNVAFQAEDLDTYDSDCDDV